MKKILFSFALVAMFGMVSCNKEASVKQPVKDGGPVEVTVSIKGSTTKAVDVTYSNESKVSTLQVFVFNGDDLEAHRSVSNSLMALIPATAGERTVWAVVNAPDIYSVLNVSDSDPMTLSKLKAYTSELSANTKDNFVMVGEVTQELVDGGNVPITVKRIVSRVSIGKISASLKDYREGYSVKINKIYLINVAANANYGFSLDPSVWVNQLAHNDAAYDALLYDDLTADNIEVRNNVYKLAGSVIHEHEAYTPESIANATYVLADGVTMDTDNSYTKEHVFYPYPNPFPRTGNPNGYEDTWCPRGSMLVIDATMVESDGVTEHPGYYPIILPALERNKTYSIDEVKITRLPGDEPYKPIETGESQVTITVNDWELGLNMGTIAI